MKRTINRKWIAVLFVVVLGLLTACGSKKDVHPPEPIQEGVDRCEVCKMMIADDRHATQLLLNDGRSLKFDDIGDMALWVKNNGLENVNVRYVRDYHTEEWIQIEQAFFAYDEQFHTPMAYGVLSFKSKEDAEQYVRDQGTGVVMTYEQLENHTWTQNKEMMDHHHDHDGHDHEGHGHDHDGHEHDGHDDDHGHNGEDADAAQ